MNRLIKAILYTLFGGLTLSGCGQESVSNLGKNLSVQSNAYLFAIQDGPDGSWELAKTGNIEFKPYARSYTLDDDAKRYGLAFACPSQREGQQHRVYLYFLTTAELPVTDHICRRPLEQQSTRRMYGAVRGVYTAGDHPALRSTAVDNSLAVDELAVVGLSRDIELSVLEGYGAKVLGEERDVIAMKGTLNSADNSIAPTRYYRSVVSTSKEVERWDIDFRIEEYEFTGNDDFRINHGTVAAVTSSAINGVNISGLASGERLQAVLGFGTQKNSFLPVKKTEQASFDYQGVPEYFQNGFRFMKDQGEGHELHVRVFDSGGNPTRRLAHFFRQPEDITLSVPRLPGSNEAFAISASDTPGFRELTVTLPPYSDANYGPAALYGMVFKGESAYDGQERPLTRDVDWIVYVSRGWVAGNPDASFKLPNLQGLQGWSKDWDFKLGSAISGDLSTFASEHNPGDILEFLRNGEFADGMSFGQIFQNASAGS